MQFPSSGIQYFEMVVIRFATLEQYLQVLDSLSVPTGARI